MVANVQGTFPQEMVDGLSRGAFLTTMAGGKVNTMTIGWGSIGIVWGKPTVMVMVRQSRFTHDLLQKTAEFTVTVPSGDMKKALGFCGSKSGRDMDKLAAVGLGTVPGKVTATPVVDCAGVHYECRIVYRHDAPTTELTAENVMRWYSDEDYHTLYYGEIVASYTK